MADVSFAHVPAEGFTAFSVQLDNDEWGSIDVSTYLGADGRPVKSLGSAPALVLLKVNVLMAVTGVVRVVQSTGGAKGFDELWGNVQKRFSGLIAVARASLNPQEKAAANRLYTTLLLGKSGEGQTRLAYQQEVDFGRKQMRLAEEAQSASDIALLGLGSMMASIASSTEDLAAAIAHGPAELAPARQRKAAVNHCVHVFGTVYRALDWLAEFGETTDQKKALALRASFDDLIARYPARPAKPKTTTPQPAPVVTPTVT